MKNVFLAIPTIRQGGGAARVVLNLLNNLDRSKFSITLVVNVLEVENMPQLPADIEVIELGISKSRFAIFQFCHLIHKKKPDLVFSTMGHLNVLIATFRWALPSGTKFIARETNTVSVKNKYQPYPRLFDFLYKNFYKNFDRIIAQCDYMKLDLVQNYSIPENIVLVINNPIDTIHIDNLLEYDALIVDDNASHSVLRLIAVGRLSHQKGYDILFGALALLQTSFHLDIYGTGPEKGRLSEMAERMGIAGNISFHGFVNNPYAKMAKAHLLVLSSRYEGFPNVLLEANYCGVGVVAFDAPGGTAEIIEDGRNGYLVEFGDCLGFAKAIEKAARAPFDAAQMRHMMKTTYGLDVILGQYERLFDDESGGVSALQ